MTLQISKDLSLPLDAVMKQHFIVGQSSSGKTNEAVVFVEELAKAHQQFVVVDEPGVWWGLRSSADGKGEGLSVFLLGGEHGDMPLEPTAGAIVADNVVSSGHSFVLDLSLMRRAQWGPFLVAFFTRLYEVKAKKKDPLHLVLDEADLFAPDSPNDKGFGKDLLEAVDNMARRGRARGLRLTLSTQRPQVINKSIIAQSDAVHCFRLSHPLDRKALESWVRGNASKEELDIFNTELASLEQGTCYLWSPQWLKTFRRVHIRLRETFDSSITPEVGVKAAKPRVMTKVDIEGLRAKIAETIEAAKAEDPKLLREEIKKREARIAELERQAEAMKVWTEPERIVEQVPAPYIPEPLMHAVANAIGNLRQQADCLLEGLAAAEVDGSKILKEKTAKELKKIPETANGSHAREPLIAEAPKTPTKLLDGEVSKLRAGERAILRVIAEHQPKVLTRTQIGTLVGIRGSGTTFTTYLGVLQRAGLVEKKGDGIVLTRAGETHTKSVPRRPMSRAEIVQIWLQRFRAGERTILETVVARGPTLRTELGRIAGIDPLGTTMTTYLGTLKRNDLIVVDGQRITLGPALSEAR